MDDTATAAPAVDTSDPLANLDSKSANELASLETDLVSQFDAADEANDLDQMSSLADQIDQVRSAMDSKGPEAENPDENAAEGGTEEDTVMTAAADTPTADTRTPAAEAPAAETEATTTQTTTDAAAPADSTTAPEGTPAEETAPAETEGSPSEDAPTEGAPTEGTDTGAPAEVSSTEGTSSVTAESTTTEAIAASGDTKEESVDIPEDRAPVTVTASANEILAGTDIPGFAAGTPFTRREDVAVAMEKRLDTVRRARGGDGDQHTVATIIASASDDRTLDPNDHEGNLRKIENLVRVEAITASGGYCAPLETRYDIFGTGTTSRPVRDALAGFQAKRGGIRYVAAPKITDFDNALGLWTAANDASPAVDGSSNVIPKPEMTVVCQPERTALVDAVTLQLKFGNLMTRAFPELIDRNNQLALVAHARFAERALLNKMTALSTAVTSAFKLGTARDWLNAVGRAATAYRHRYRMDPGQPLRVLAPIWVRDAVREDLAMQLPGDNALDLADSAIDRYLAARNVNPSWHLDAPGFADEVAASALDDFPATFEWYIYAEGAFIFLDGGTLDLGIVRDASLVGTNNYKTFTETFEGVARIGADSIKVTTTTKPAGATAATVNTVA